MSSRGGDLPGNYASDYERQLMQRILAETTEFPLEFRNWLKRFIIDEVKQEAIDSGGGPGDASGFNPANWMPGIIIPVAFGTTPTYSLVCDGREVSRLTYANLFAVIHETWGAGDGTLTFNLPDFRDRALYGHGTTVGLFATDLGALGTRGPKHSHAVTATAASNGAHSHGGSTGNGGTHSHGGSIDGVGDHGHGASSNMAGDHAHGPSTGNGFATSQGTTAALGSGGTIRNIVAGNAPVTSVDGSHLHTINIAGGGGHSHGLNIDGVGDHTHPIPSDGAHTHTVTGTVSGGGVQDTPGYAGVHYVITTGAVS